MLTCFSSRPNWDSPTPLSFWGGTLAGEEVRAGSQFGGGERHCDTLGIYVLVLYAKKLDGETNCTNL
jgi:hypothetical protein